MKTLDEVIEAIEVCRDSYVAGKIIKSDALHYLKEYQVRLQNLQDMMDRYDISVKNYEEAVENCRIAEAKYTKMVLESNRNDPLTWFELRMMDEKPVWIEVKNGERKWVLLWIHPDDIDEIYVTDSYGLRGKLNQIMYLRGEIKAYRKERE